MNIHDSIYNAAHGYKGGIPALAVRMNKKEAHEHMAAIAELVSRVEGMVR